MSNKYKRLFHKSNTLYCVKCPILISAYAILSDSSTNKLFAQIKFQSISDKRIKALTINIEQFDSAGRPLNNSIEYNYLDLNIIRNVEFGSNYAIPLNNALVREIRINIKEIIFFDNSIINPKNEWEILPELQEIQNIIHDEELIKEYHNQFGYDSRFLSNEYKDLWQCTCGCINNSNEAQCFLCKRLKSKQPQINIDILEKSAQKRIEKEHIQKQEAKKRENKLYITLACAMVIAAIIIMPLYVKNKNKTETSITIADPDTYELTKELIVGEWYGEGTRMDMDTTRYFAFYESGTYKYDMEFVDRGESYDSTGYYSIDNETKRISFEMDDGYDNRGWQCPPTLQFQYENGEAILVGGGVKLKKVK